MISDKQLEANRSNALLSTGPKTEEGRKRSSMNARRHGITGQVTTMTDDDRAAHDKLSQALIKDLAPQGAMEVQLAQRIATDSWRLNRISAVEDNLFALGQLQNGGELCPENEQIDAALTTARVFTRESKQLQLLHPLRAAHQPQHPKESRHTALAPGNPQSGMRSRHEGSSHPP